MDIFTKIAVFSWKKNVSMTNLGSTIHYTYTSYNKYFRLCLVSEELRLNEISLFLQQYRCILIQSDEEMKGKQLHNSKDCLLEFLFMIFRTHYQQEIKRTRKIKQSAWAPRMSSSVAPVFVINICRLVFNVYCKFKKGQVCYRFMFYFKKEHRLIL